MNHVALIVGWVVLGTTAVIGTVAAICAAWWAAGKVIEQLWTTKLFYEVAARILDERHAKDRNQWPPKDRHELPEV